MGGLRVRFSEEEKEEVKQVILKGIDDEKNATQIADSLRIISKYYY